jgi:hypothetical protein
MKKILLSITLIVSMIGTAQAASITATKVGNLRNNPDSFTGTYTFAVNAAAGLVHFVNRPITVPKAGNPWNWIKKSPISIAATAAVVGAGYAIDELTGQITQGTTQPDPNAYYEAGYHWVTANWPSGPSAGAVALGKYYNDHPAADSAEITDIIEVNPTRLYVYITGYSGIYVLNNKQYIVNKIDCGCTTEEPTIDNTSPVEASDLWTLFDPLVNSETLKYWAQDLAGNPYIYAPVAAEQAAIASDYGHTLDNPYPNVITDPLDATAPEVLSDSPPLEIPDDYAKQGTLENVDDSLSDIKEAASNIANVIADGLGIPGLEDLGDSFDRDPNNDPLGPIDSLLTDIGDPDNPLGFLPDLPAYSSNCQNITASFFGRELVFPGDAGCQRLDTMKILIGWFLYMLTAYSIVSMFLDRAGRPT